MIALSKTTKGSSSKRSQKLAPSSKARAPKSTPSAFIKRVQNTLQSNALIAPKSSVLVAVSGGPDSMALLFVLHALSEKYQWQLSIAHVNYGLRGKESLADEQLVQTTADRLGLPLHILRKKSLKTSSEDSLRKVRYEFFESLVKKLHFTVVALAHHQDDQAETVLMRLIRGSGSTGLSGMRFKRGIYVRPFLSVPKRQILEYLHSASLPYRLDASNAENLYLRNKIRNTLLPLLETYNPKIKKVLADTAHTFQQEQDNNFSTGVITPFIVTKAVNTYSFSQKSWQSVPESQKSSVLRQLFTDNNLSLPTKALTNTLLSDLNQTTKKGLDKVYSRLKLHLNNGMIDIHFNELD